MQSSFNPEAASGNIFEGLNRFADYREENWDTESRIIADISDLQSRFGDVREICIRSDGEAVAAIVGTGDGSFSVWSNGKLWDIEFEKIWHLKFGPDGRLSALASNMGVWTVVTDGEPWSGRYEFLWDMMFARQGKDIIVAAQNDRSYLAVKNDTPWDCAFYALSNLTVCAYSSRIAAAVRTEPLKEGEIETFKRGCFSVAVDGKAWKHRFVNAWESEFSPDGRHVAAEVRTSLYDYTIAVDGNIWSRTYRSVWHPRFSPIDGSVTAPVRFKGKWSLAKDANLIWKNRYIQLWHHLYSPDGSKLAAIVAPKFGCWTIAVNDIPWKHVFRDLVTNALFSPDGEHIACIGKENGKWTIAVDDHVWDISANMAWPPVFSPDCMTVAAKVEIDGRYTIALNGKLMNERFDMLWGPVFSEDGQKIRFTAIMAGSPNGQISRRVVELKDLI